MTDPFAQAATDILASEIGRDATFQPAVGAPVATRALLQRNAELTDTYGTVIEVQTLISLPRADVGLPEHGDTVTVGGQTLRCDRIVGYTDHLVRISCS